MTVYTYNVLSLFSLFGSRIILCYRTFITVQDYIHCFNFIYVNVYMYRRI